jgi:predicted MFS family arabinose efflux permease
MSFRLLGLFLILPILPWYQHAYVGATPALMGWVIGAYGLTQGLLQIPMGILSDKIGRSPVIMAGLLLFIAGSVVAALATRIDVLILGRAIQGAGAVGATILACLADLTREQVRTKAMAMVGVSIGLAFSLAFCVGPLLEPEVGLAGLFWITAGLGVLSLLFCHQWVPVPTHADTSRTISPHLFKQVFKNKVLFKLNVSVFCLHALFSASFLMIPSQLVNNTHLAKGALWQLYLLALAIAIVGMGFWVRLSHRRGDQKNLLVGAVLCFIASIVLLGVARRAWHAVGGLMLLFTAFNAWEARVRAWVSRIAPPALKGTALGLYSTAQFLGIFVGGVVGGRLWMHAPQQGIVMGAGLLGFVWILVLSRLKLTFKSVDDS